MSHLHTHHMNRRLHRMENRLNTDMERLFRLLSCTLPPPPLPPPPLPPAADPSVSSGYRPTVARAVPPHTATGAPNHQLKLPMNSVVTSARQRGSTVRPLSSGAVDSSQLVHTGSECLPMIDALSPTGGRAESVASEGAGSTQL
jgi:hypothetical protein